MGMYGGTEQVPLRSGAIVRCGCGVRSDSSERVIWVTVEQGLEVVEEARLPVPACGFGGAELVVSADERWVALFLYSGQSEQGWELFGLEPLRHVGGTGYVHGMGDAPRFSPDGTWLVMAVSVLPVVRGTEEYAEEALDGSTDELVLDWGALYTQRVPHGPILVTPIGTPVPRTTEPDVVHSWEIYDTLEIADDHVVIRLPWGSTVAPLPLEGAITTSRLVSRPSES